MTHELCDIVDEWIEIFHEDGKPLPPPTAGYSYGDKLADFLLESVEPVGA